MKVNISPTAIKYCKDKGMSISEFHGKFDRDLDNIVTETAMNFKEIKEGFGDCDWMRAFLNGYTVDAVLWLMDRVEELEQHTKEDKGDKTMSVEKCGNQAEARAGQVDQELNKAEDAASRLLARIDELEKQLFAVLHVSESPSPTLGKEAQVETSLVPLAGRIRDHYRLLQDLGIRVGEILERLEIR